MCPFLLSVLKCHEGFVGIGVPIGTDAFAQNFIVKTCSDIIDDVEKLDTIEDGFIHYQYLRFCEDTRLSNTQMVGTRLARSGHTWSSICHILRVELLTTFTQPTK